MKTEWQFSFWTKDLYFDKEYKYTGRSKLGTLLDSKGDPRELAFELKIVPDNDCKDPRAEQTGCLFITLPLSYDDARPVIHELTFYIAQKISFESGNFNIHGGMTICKRIPETPEEEKEVGDKPYAAEMHMEEVLPIPKFDSDNFINKSKDQVNIGLMSQHNITKKAQNPIDRFLGFFRILESQFPPRSKKQTLKDCLQNSDELFSIYKTIFTFDSIDSARDSYNNFIHSIVHARHRCAHLKLNKNFGYIPIDPKVSKEVEPFIMQLELLTYETIRRLKSDV